MEKIYHLVVGVTPFEDHVYIVFSVLIFSGLNVLIHI